MFKQSVAASVALGLTMFSPTSAKADLADGLIGGVVGGAVGAIVTDSIRNNNTQRAPQPQATTRTVVHTAPSLNSQYSQTERRQIQTSLNTLGYNAGAVDGVLGKRSRAAIASFQASRGDVQTGQLTAAQYTALTNGAFGPAAAGLGQQQNAFGTPQPVFVSRPLQPNEIFLLQQSLLQLGFYNGLADGVDSPATQAAANAFLTSQNRNPAQITSVQRVVLAGSTAGLILPPYLVNEANAQFSTMQAGHGFGTAQQPQINQQSGTTTVSQPQAGTALFGTAPQQQQLVPQQEGQTAADVLVNKQPAPGQSLEKSVTVSSQGTTQQDSGTYLATQPADAGLATQPQGTAQQPVLNLGVSSGTE